MGEKTLRSEGACKHNARRMSRFQLASVTVLLLLTFVELVSGFCCQDGVPERGCVWCRQIGDSQSTGSSSDFRWCSPRCNLRRFPECAQKTALECANNPEC